MKPLTIWPGHAPMTFPAPTPIPFLTFYNADGRTADVHIKDGVLTFGGDLPVDEAARLLFDGLLRSIDEAWLERAATKATPAGYVLVPVQPTVAMLDAARNAPHDLVLRDSRIAEERARCASQYRAMIAAGAASPQVKREVGVSNNPKQFVCTYNFEGAEWGITIPAESEAEASRRLRAIGTTGRVDGELMATIPAYPGVGLLIRPLIFLRNLFSWQQPRS